MNRRQEAASLAGTITAIVMLATLMGLAVCSGGCGQGGMPPIDGGALDGRVDSGSVDMPVVNDIELKDMSRCYCAQIIGDGGELLGPGSECDISDPAHRCTAPSFCNFGGSDYGAACLPVLPIADAIPSDSAPYHCCQIVIVDGSEYRDCGSGFSGVPGC